MKVSYRKVSMSISSFILYRVSTNNTLGCTLDTSNVKSSCIKHPILVFHFNVCVISLSLPRQRRQASLGVDGSTMSGSLQRRKKSKRKWKRLWFLLKDKVLYTFTTREVRGHRVSRTSPRTLPRSHYHYLNPFWLSQKGMLFLCNICSSLLLMSGPFLNLSSSSFGLAGLTNGGDSLCSLSSLALSPHKCPVCFCCTALLFLEKVKHQPLSSRYHQQRCSPLLVILLHV